MKFTLLQQKSKSSWAETYGKARIGEKISAMEELTTAPKTTRQEESFATQR
jgi:hypothetical protein